MAFKRKLNIIRSVSCPYIKQFLSTRVLYPFIHHSPIIFFTASSTISAWRSRLFSKHTNNTSLFLSKHQWYIEHSTSKMLLLPTGFLALFMIILDTCVCELWFDAINSISREEYLEPEQNVLESYLTQGTKGLDSWIHS